jgi:hypothetical protein
MSQNINIIEIDNKIRRLYESKIKETLVYINRLETMKKILASFTLNNRIKNDLKSEIRFLEQEIKYLDLFKFYFFESTETLEKFSKLIDIPTFNGFFKKNNCNQEKKKLVEDYFKIIKPYQHVIHCFTIANTEINKCKYCNTASIYRINDSHYIICSRCFSERNTLINVNNTFTDNKLNILNKYTQDRRIQFRDCINQFQGKQTTALPEYVIDNVKSTLEYFGIKKNVKLSHINMILKYLSYTKFYDDVVLIHSKITGIIPKSVEHLEEKLMHDFDLILKEYSKHFKQHEKKNFNTQFVLLQLLKKHGFNCDPDHYSILKINERKIFSDIVCKTLFEKLNWVYTSIL